MSAADRLYPARPILAASVAVFRGEEALIARRVGAAAAGAWSLPGGVVELGETLAEAALRELREEVAVEAEIVAFNRHVEVVDRDENGRLRAHFVVASFLARWISGEGTPGPEASEVAWVRPLELSGRWTTPQLPEILRSAQAIWERAR
jgi:ADP-ribose pyrophosphatase YjhB (NUDIX family)